MFVFLQKYPLLLFLILSCLCIGVRQEGYLFLLDDSLYLQNFSWVYEKFTQLNAGVFFTIFHQTTKVIPGWILQRLIYISTLFSAGILGYRISSLLVKDHIALFFAGIFSMINPWVYGRILDGQRYVVLSISMVGWTYYFLCKRTGLNFLRGILTASLSIMMSPHAIFFQIIMMTLWLIFDDIENLYKRFLKIFFVSIAMIMLNSHWIFPGLLGKANSDFSLIGRIDQRHFEGFATNAGNTNVGISTLGGFGFRGERQHRFITIQTTAEKTWVILFLMIFTLVGCGAYVLYNQKRYKILGFYTSLGLISYILGIGISGNTLVAPITQRMYDSIPFYIGLREPQKWIGLLMIVYCVLGSVGVAHIIKRYFPSNDITDSGMKGFLLLLPICYTPFLLFGGWNQLVPKHYPSEWNILKSKYDRSTICPQNQRQCYDILVFPWHMYQSFSFTRGPVAHPIANFFEHQKVLVGDNMEMPNIYTQSNRAESKMIEKYIGPGGSWSATGLNNDTYIDFIKDLNNHSISSILLLKEVDWHRYEPHLEQLSKQGLLQKSLENDRFILYNIVG